MTLIADAQKTTGTPGAKTPEPDAFDLPADEEKPAKKKKAKAKTPPAEAPAPEEPDDPEPETDLAAVTADPDAQRAEVKDLIQKSVLTDCRDGIVALLQKYGVKKASAVPDDKIGDFLADLREVCAA
ncbi:hypothetical protein RAH42_13135 (plasmid) [Pyramidobacter sp. YE332]|nr:hypothetical protein [Pyramidobacter sp. YE332]WOL41356.1 hypothetical protein RAH42_13135 [Pyramidobacter sp. YE332]